MRKSSRFILALMATTSLETANALAAECPEGRCPSRYTCQCDSAGRITEQVDTRTSRTTVIEYDNQGNRTSSTIYNSAEAVANNTPTSQTRYTYDANGKQTSSTSYNNAEAVASNTPTSQTRYTYDANGKQTSSTSYNNAEAIENNIPTSQTRYTYDSNGNQTSYTSYNNAEAVTNNTPTSQTRYTYDSNGNQTSYTSYNNAEAVANNTPTRQTRYTYDENGKQTSIMTYNNAEAIENNIPTNQTRYTYDANGKQTSITTYNNAEAIENNTPTRQTRYTYDENSNITTTASYSQGLPSSISVEGTSVTIGKLYTNGTLVGYTGHIGGKEVVSVSTTDGGQSITTYGADNKRTSATHYDENGVPISQYVWSYDSVGHLVCETRYETPEAIANGTPTRQAFSKYDEAGHQISSTVYDGIEAFTNGVPTYQMTTTYDDNGRIVFQTEYNSLEAIINDEPTSQHIYTYDENNKSTHLIYGSGICFFSTCSKSDIYYPGNSDVDIPTPEVPIIDCTTGYISGCIGSGSDYSHILDTLYFPIDCSGSGYAPGCTDFIAGSDTFYNNLYQNHLDCSGSGSAPGCNGYDASVDSLNHPAIDCSGAGYIAGCVGYSGSADISYTNPQIVCISGYDCGEYKNADGSTTIIKNGQIVGYKNKRIYTVEEATKLSKPTGNAFKLRYK